jgi:hypothetical protein
MHLRLSTISAGSPFLWWRGSCALVWYTWRYWTSKEMGENLLKFGTYVRVGNAAEAYELLQ